MACLPTCAFNCYNRFTSGATPSKNHSNMKRFYPKVLASLCATFTLLTTSAQAQVVISEYVEGSGDNKCIEFWNPTGSAVNLGDFGYRAYHNGNSSPNYSFALPAVTLNPNDVYVICHTDASGPCASNANSTDGRLLFNGDDAIAVYDLNTGNNVDVFGSIGEDPGSFWTGACLHRTADRTLRRLAIAFNGVTAPSTGFPTLCDNWDEYGFDNCSHLGIPPQEVQEPFCEPIISQYVEGSFSCKFIEIYNPCCHDIDLNDYELRIAYNTCISTGIIPLTGILSGNILPSGGTVVIYNAMETCSPWHSLNNYPSNFRGYNSLLHNGSDAVILTFSHDGSPVDIVGNICENVVWSDPFCGLSTENMTLVRNPNVCVGVDTDPATGFPTLCAEWSGLPQNDLTGLGSHGSDCTENCRSGKADLSSTALEQPSITAFPNPFSNSTTIRFQVAATAPTKLMLYDITGACVATLFDGVAEAGQVHDIRIDQPVIQVAGTYFYQLHSGNTLLSGKLLKLQ